MLETVGPIGEGLAAGTTGGLAALVGALGGVALATAAMWRRRRVAGRDRSRRSRASH